MTAPEVSVVVPVYRNEASLVELLDRLDGALADEDREYVLVVDGSPDQSLELLRGETARRPHLRVVELARNFGQHAALCAGFESARGQVVLVLDADLQQRPEELPAFLAKWREGHDFVSGWRRARQDPLFRRIGSGGMNRLVRTITGVPLKDWGCPVAAIDRSIFSRVSEHGEQRRFLKPLVAKLSRNWAELEVEGLERKGDSAYSFLTLVGIALDFTVSFSNRPFQRLAGGGFCLFLLGLLVGAVYIGLRLFAGIDDIPKVQVGVVIAVLLGLQIVILGALGEFTHRIYHLVQGEPLYTVRTEHTAGSDREA